MLMYVCIIVYVYIHVCVGRGTVSHIGDTYIYVLCTYYSRNYYYYNIARC